MILNIFRHTLAHQMNEGGANIRHAMRDGGANIRNVVRDGGANIRNAVRYMIDESCLELKQVLQ